MCSSKNVNRPVPHILPLEGATNFRELGGYRATDGKTVKYGLLYRGGALYDLKSDADRATMESLGLKLVLDFRSAGESEGAPDWIPSGARYQRIGAMYYPDGAELDFSPEGMERLGREFAALPQGQTAVDSLVGFYARMPFENPAFQALFHALEAGDVPVLFHCTSGKDRTGVAAMLILLALGVDRDTAIVDYLETNRCRAAEIELLRKQHRGLEEEDPKQWEMRLIGHGVLPRCGNASLDAILKRYGSWDAYFLSEYGLDHDRLTALRRAYLC